MLQNSARAHSRANPQAACGCTSCRDAVARAAADAAANNSKPASGGRVRKRVQTVDRQARKSDRRALNAAMRRTAVRALEGLDATLAGRLHRCGRFGHGQGPIGLQLRQTAQGPTASMTGVVTCGSVWCCAACSAKKSAERAEEVNTALRWARALGYSVSMLTLTFAHTRRDDLAKILAAQKEALRAFRQSKPWRALRAVGTIGATEITHGRNGFHPHEHIVVILPHDSASALKALEGLRAEWLRSLVKQGLTGNRHAFQVQGASEAGDYVTKFAAASEVTMTQTKSGRGEGRNPWEVLSDAAHGCKRSAMIWATYAQAVKGRNQLVWSRGLRAKVEAWAEENPAPGSGEDEPDPAPVILKQWAHNSREWAYASLRICALKHAAETGGDILAAETGPTDYERWQEYLEASEIIEKETLP